MEKEQLEEIAIHFRQAIVAAKENREFNHRDRMNSFPVGCCDDSADLFSHYLYQKYRIISTRVDGSYHDGNPEHNCNHSWQEVDGLVIDLTGSQFKYNPIFLYYDKDVYVGTKEKFHNMFKVERSEPCKGIKDLGQRSWDRMFDLYSRILKYC